MKLIAGIDPGKTAGIAIVDISSDFVKTFSKTNLSISGVCEFLAESGEPIIIATDKKIAPNGVKKICAAFNARLSYPKNDISIAEKKMLTKDFTCGNTHEMDALAAAILAKRYFSTTFNKVDYTLEKKNLPHLSDTVKELLVKQEVGNIEQAINLLTKGEKEKEVKIIPKIIETKAIRELNEKLRLKERAIEILREQIAELRSENAELRRMMHHGISDSRLENLRKSMASLKKEKEDLLSEKEKEKLLEKLKERYEIIYRETDFTDPEQMKDKIILLDSNNFSIARFSPKAIISDKTPKNADVPVISQDKLNIRKINNILVADKKEVEEAIRQNFLSWLDKYKERFHEH